MKEKILERFLKYVSFDTQSNDKTNTHPSTEKQKELGKYLVNELKSLGISNAFMDENSYVYAKIEGSIKTNKTIGLIAHLDTALECSGIVNPKVIEKYDGKDIELNGISITNKMFPFLKDKKDETLVTTDGKSLLGGDDKAGIAIIVSLIEKLLKGNYEYPNLFISFTPDEEIGEGTACFNYDLFKVDFAYTLDGGPINIINYENFNAATAFLEFNGISIHPGSAKDKMVNSSLLAMEFNSLLPPIRPDNTENYEGFNHITSIFGGVKKTQVEYIIRNHDMKLFNKQKDDFINISKKMNEKYGYDAVNCKVVDSYFNMKEIVDKAPYVLEYPVEAIKEANLNPTFVPIRGGTDGARLSYNGIITPNLGTGGYNCHGPYEFVSIDEMNKMVDILINMLSKIK